MSKDFKEEFTLTHHAKTRMDGRGIASHTIQMVLEFGREIRAKGAIFHVIGKWEIQQFQKLEPRLKDLEGVQVLTTEDGRVITAYRNRNLRQIKPIHRSQRHLNWSCL